MPSQESFGEVLLRVIEEIVAPGAAVDAAGALPRVQANALAAAGLLGLPLLGEA